MSTLTFSLPTMLMVVPAAGGLITMSMFSRRSAGIASITTFLVQAALIVLSANVLANGVTDRIVAAPMPGAWLPDLGINWSVRVDWSSLGFIALTTLVTGCAAIFTWWADRDRPAPFHGLMWLTAAAACGLWVSRDLVLFYVFFELMLVPLLLLVGGWGGEQRLRAALTMFIYTLCGSLPMLVGVIGLGLAAGTFSLDEIAQQAIAGTLDAPTWTLACFLLAFAVKAPVFPLHGWMPLSYREAPAEVTAVLSGVISKAAAFGMLVVVLPAYPKQLSGTWGDVITWVAIFSLLYGSITAFRQPDARGVIAYSSMAQMGLITLGLSTYLHAGGHQAVSGAYMQSINHGIVSASLFLIAGMVEMRAGTGKLRELGTLAGGRPIFATVALVVTMCALAVPGSNTFAGELMILLGAFQGAWIWGAVGGIAIVLAAMYALRLLSAMMHSPEGDTADRAADARARFGLDLRAPELSFLAPLLVALVVLSVWPNSIHRAMNDRPVPLPPQTKASK